VTFRKYLVLFGIALFGSVGDSLLSRGMKDIGTVSLTHLQSLIVALANFWVLGGIVLLIGFFATYMTALSWADLTYVLPATSIGYVIIALIAKFVLHEQVTTARWIGILLITSGVGFIAGGPALTPLPEHSTRESEQDREPELASARGRS
jgi:drug/metabolite transporter (DMT)-like permease